MYPIAHIVYNNISYPFLFHPIMYLGPFYFDTKEIFLIIGGFLIGLTIALDIPLFWFDRQELLLLTILIFFTKGLLPSIHNEAFFLVAIVAICSSLYMPLFQVVLFYFVTFFLLRLLRVI